MSGHRRRRAGLLAHISSLPGRYAVGDIGPSARKFARLLGEMGLAAWQVLPTTPVDAGCAYSPYSSPSAFAGNALFISPDDLVEAGLLTRDEASRYEVPPGDSVDWDAAASSKREMMDAAHARFRHGDAHFTTFRELNERFWSFCRDNAWWLEDYALYRVLKGMEDGAPWGEWRAEFRLRDWSVLDPLKEEPKVASELDRVRFEQFIFFDQFRRLRGVCAECGVAMIGDLPIYVAYDSADVWGHQDLFWLDGEGRPEVVAGVPPDYFSETGQRWGSPIYRWDRMRDDGWSWWLGRLSHALVTADVVRIDHFRGMMGYWEIPAEEETAINGRWQPGPGGAFLSRVRDLFARDGAMPFIAEDLGIITDDVREAMDDYHLPGMKVLQFAFGDGMPHNPYAPHNHRRSCVVYAGTHDNDTTIGWWHGDADDTTRANFERCVGRPMTSDDDVRRTMMRFVLGSTAELAVLTAQDLLGLGSEARMNTPGTTHGNWAWRMRSTDALASRSAELREMLEFYGRAPAPHDEDDDKDEGVSDDD